MGPEESDINFINYSQFIFRLLLWHRLRGKRDDRETVGIHCCIERDKFEVRFKLGGGTGLEMLWYPIYNLRECYAYNITL